MFKMLTQYCLFLRENLKLLIFIVSFLSVLSSIAQKNDTIDPYNFNLSELSQLEVISVSKILQKFNEVPATIRVITAKEIKENSYFTLEEALSSLPGFQFRNIQGFNSYVFQRGIPSQNNLILVLIDGVQINELNSGGFYGGGQYNLVNVEQIEVVYGPASVIYGTNAISGIINIITKSALEKQNLNVNALVGSFNSVYGDASYCYTNEDKTFGVRLSSMCKTTEKADLAGAADDYNWTDEMENFENDYALDAKITFKDLTAGLNFQNKQSSRTTNYPSVGTIYKERNTLWNIYFINAYIKYRHEISKKIMFSTILYNRNATVANNTISKIVDTAQFRYYRPNLLLGSESVLNFNLTEKLLIIGGLVFEYEKLSDGFSVTRSDSPDITPPTPSKPTMQENYLVSTFFELQYKFLKGFQLFAGARLDNSSVYHQVVTPRLGLIYNLKKFTFKAVYGEGYRAPKPWDYTTGIGNLNLDPERLQSFEISSIYSASKYLRLQLSIYKNNMDNVFFKNIIDNSYQWINNGKITTNGAELSFNYEKNNLKFYANYTYNYSYNNEKQIVDEISKHTANSGITYTLLKYVVFNVRAFYIGERKNPKPISTTGSNYISPALVFNVNVSLINFHNFDIHLIVKNLFNKEYYHTSNMMPDRYRQSQRTLMLKLGYTF